MLVHNSFHRLVPLLPLLPPLVVPGAGALASFAIVIAFLIFSAKVRENTMRLVPQGWLRTTGIGISAGLLIAVISQVLEHLVVSATGQPVDLSAYEAVVGNVPNYLIMLAIGIGIGGVLEELTFRGFVVGYGMSEFGPTSGLPLVVVSAAAFGVAHLYQGLSGVITTGMTGLLLGLLYLYTERSLGTAIIAHAVINIVGVTLIFLGVGM